MRSSTPTNGRRTSGSGSSSQWLNDLGRAPTLRDLRPNANPDARVSGGEVEVADIEAHKLREPEARTQGEREDQVIPRMASAGGEECMHLVAGEGLGAEIRHRRTSLRTQGWRWGPQHQAKSAGPRGGRLMGMGLPEKAV